jgi:hypothetical protein
MKLAGAKCGTSNSSFPSCSGTAAPRDRPRRSHGWAWLAWSQPGKRTRCHGLPILDGQRDGGSNPT